MELHLGWKDVFPIEHMNRTKVKATASTRANVAADARGSVS